MPGIGGGARQRPQEEGRTLPPGVPLTGLTPGGARRHGSWASCAGLAMSASSSHKSSSPTYPPESGPSSLIALRVQPESTM